MADLVTSNDVPAATAPASSAPVAPRRTVTLDVDDTKLEAVLLAALNDSDAGVSGSALLKKYGIQLLDALGIHLGAWGLIIRVALARLK